jgi:hypothetical protein
MLFTIYCAFIIIIIMRGSKRELFTIKEIRITLVVCFQDIAYYLSY